MMVKNRRRKLAGSALASSAFLLTACMGKEPGLCSASLLDDGAQITEQASDEDDLGMLQARASDGSFLNIYFDKASEADARGHAKCLVTQISLLTRRLRDTRKRVQWDSVVFVQDGDYIPRRGPDIQPRWVISTNEADPERLQSRTMVLEVLPHEQVHSYQTRAGARLPLWFLEGHATWIGLNITELLNPEVGLQSRERHLAEFRDYDGSTDLRAWGKRSVKRAAIMRQVSAEDRERMEADSNYTPKGAYKFTMDDFETDESNSAARYAASLLLFEELEELYGAESVHAWVAQVTSMPGTVGQKDLEESFLDVFGDDLSKLLSKW